MTVSVSSLRIDTKEARRLAGVDPEGGPGEEDVRKLQTKMLSAESLAAQQHPMLEFDSRSVARDGGRLVARGPLTTRGRTREVSIPITISPAGGDRYDFRGEFSVKQTDFGIDPETVAGVVNVEDVVFSMRARLTDAARQ